MLTSLSTVRVGVGCGVRGERASRRRGVNSDLCTRESTLYPKSTRIFRMLYIIHAHYVKQGMAAGTIIIRVDDEMRCMMQMDIFIHPHIPH